MLRTAAFLLLLATAAQAQEIALSGQNLHPTTLTREVLADLPQVEMDVTFQTSKGEKHGTYRGPALWPILDAAGLRDGIERNAELRRSFAVIGADGYEVVFSVGEVHPDFGATPVLVALSVDGGPLPDDEGLRLIVPGDTRGARNVYNVTRIELR